MKHPTRTLIERKSRTGTFKGILDKSEKTGISDKERHDLCILYMPLFLWQWQQRCDLSELA
ncbi:MAG: hypothetical protein C4K47_07610 [Candidatus Thorarchaeota archaeon]|nr:MAG: hypothetical protein C4K47_07610 [Candidatus Thorarchaeota archaeon]